MLGTVSPEDALLATNDRLGSEVVVCVQLDDGPALMTACGLLEHSSDAPDSGRPRERDPDLALDMLGVYRLVDPGPKAHQPTNPPSLDLSQGAVTAVERYEAGFVFRFRVYASCCCGGSPRKLTGAST
jgi:hypothetical protein